MSPFPCTVPGGSLQCPGHPNTQPGDCVLHRTPLCCPAAHPLPVRSGHQSLARTPQRTMYSDWVTGRAPVVRRHLQPARLSKLRNLELPQRS